MTSYMQNGVDTYFDILVTNEDPASDAGSQTIVLEGVNLDKVDNGKALILNQTYWMKR